MWSNGMKLKRRGFGVAQDKDKIAKELGIL